MNANPYTFPERDPEGWLVLNVSGGRSSAFMLRQILDANGGKVPERTFCCFANTGKERPETLDFIQEISRRWGVSVVWLEYVRQEARPKNHYRVVDHASASRKGEPFAALIDAKVMLPNVVRRMCTAELKVETIARYMRRELGIKSQQFVNILGIRYDEPRRWRKAIFEECKTIYPMVLAGVTKRDVDTFWQESPFDLGIPSDWGNCDLCFLKGKRKLLSYIGANPGATEWWIEQESKRFANSRKLNDKTMAQFSKRYTYMDLQGMVDRQGQLFEPFETLVVEGEDDESISCFCGG